MDLLCRRRVARTGHLGKRTTLLSLPLADLAIWHLSRHGPWVVSLAEAPTCYYLRLTADEAMRLGHLLLGVMGAGGVVGVVGSASPEDRR